MQAGIQWEIFMFEEPLQNFIKMGEALRKNPSAAEEFINAIENY